MFNRKIVAVGAVGAVALAFTAHNEGTRYRAYPDQGGVWTICEGHTRGVKPGATATREQCDAFLAEDMREAAVYVDLHVTVPLGACQRAALQDFVFNVGSPAFGRSTMLRKLNARDYYGAQLEFPRWDIVSGEHNQGVYNRRLREQALFNMDGKRCEAR